ncbi:MAG: signal peptidase II [Sphaerochaetaceae bacterium]
MLVKHNRKGNAGGENVSGMTAKQDKGPVIAGGREGAGNQMKHEKSPVSSCRAGCASFLPLILSALIIAADQLTKAAVVSRIPIGVIHKRIMGDFIWIVHVRNTGAAFSLGADGNPVMRVVFLIIVPIFLMILLFWAIVSQKSGLSRAQRWLVAGIMGGGMGTLCDRVFRFETGVVDFISVKFYGIFGLERWPTFNVSDSSVVVFVILLMLSLIFTKNKEN